MIFERSDDPGDPTSWYSITPEAARRQIGLWYLDGGKRIIAEMETSARANAPEPGGSVYTPQATYRARVAEDGKGAGSER